MIDSSDRNLSVGSWDIDVGKLSEVGMVRSLNEDSILTLQLQTGGALKNTLLGLFAVADGMGGHEDGEIASKLALRILNHTILTSLILPELKRGLERRNTVLISQMLEEGVKAANAAVFEEGHSLDNGMGTTLAAALVIGDTAYIANVGDSRVYLLEGKQLRQMTKDHSLVAELVATGEITPAEVYTHPRRNVITRCLGTQQDIEVDLSTETLKPGSSLLLCSDGLWEMVKDSKIKEIMLKAVSAQAACEQLVELANKNGGADNISVIVVRMCA